MGRSAIKETRSQESESQILIVKEGVEDEAKTKSIFHGSSVVLRFRLARRICKLCRPRSSIAKSADFRRQSDSVLRTVETARRSDSSTSRIAHQRQISRTVSYYETSADCQSHRGA